MSDFNSWFKKKFRDLHDAILCGDLVAGNYKKEKKKSYEAGQQSKQAEIDELQKRIDDALEKCTTGIRKQGGDYYLELVEGILKGDTK